jgi:hypothetical protein
MERPSIDGLTSGALDTAGNGDLERARESEPPARRRGRREEEKTSSALDKKIDQGLALTMIRDPNAAGSDSAASVLEN